MLVVAGCSEDDTTNNPNPTTDTGVADTSKGDTEKPDTEATDTATGSDSAADSTADSGAVDSAPEAAADTSGAICATIGQTCNDMQPCPGDQRCYGFGDNGFCAPFSPECGGFTGKLCSGGRSCVRAGGSSLGYCATPEEKPCLCGKEDAGYKVDCE
jgi:hypothetical protein